MVDDRTQRPFGSTEPARTAPKASSGSDPLAELARLIGQNDPFGEFGSAGARRASAPPAHEPPQAWTDVPQAADEPVPPQSAQDYFGAQPAAPSVLPPNFANQPFSKQAFGSTAPNDDLYQVEGSAPAYGAPSEPGYERDPYQPASPQAGSEQDDYYEDEPPSRKRLGILVIAGIFALAVIGTAGAFGYRALFGGSSAAVPPPVIKADTQPSKIVPAAANPQSNKQISDRVGDKPSGERLVSREEQPVAVTPQPDAPPPAAAPPAVGSGVVGGAEPKKVRTIAIRPDQGTPEAAPQPAPPLPVAAPAAPAPAASVQAAAPPAQAAPVRVIPTSKPAAASPPPRAAANAPRAEEPAAPARPAASANTPLSLNPNATPSAAPARPAASAPVARTAAVAPPSSGGGGYMVQISSQRSEAEAQSAFASLQGKYPGQLGGKQSEIRKVELGEKGTYYRAMVPAGDSAAAAQLCNGIKAAGGSCLVQKN
jgi:hypothetical protein